MTAPFYLDVIEIIKPVEVRVGHGSATQLSHDPEDGARIVTVTKPVELQPRTRIELDDQTRVATQSGYVLFTSPGQDIDLDPVDRVRTRYGDLDVVGEVQRWPDTRYESGVHHVECELESRTG